MKLTAISVIVFRIMRGIGESKIIARLRVWCYIVTHMVRRFGRFSWMERLTFVKLLVYCGNGIEGFFSKMKFVKTLTGTRILYILHLTGITFNPRKIFHCIRAHFPRNAI